MTTPPLNSNAAQAQAGRYLTFSLGLETYGLPVLNVREIIRLCPITPVPRMPDFIKGVINLRGTIVPIFDLRARFGEGPTSPTKNHVVVVMSVGFVLLNWLVDVAYLLLDPRLRRR